MVSLVPRTERNDALVLVCFKSMRRLAELVSLSQRTSAWHDPAVQYSKVQSTAYTKVCTTICYSVSYRGLRTVLSYNAFV